MSNSLMLASIGCIQPSEDLFEVKKQCTCLRCSLYNAYISHQRIQPEKADDTREYIIFILFIIKILYNNRESSIYAINKSLDNVKTMIYTQKVLDKIEFNIDIKKANDILFEWAYEYKKIDCVQSEYIYRVFYKVIERFLDFFLRFGYVYDSDNLFLHKLFLHKIHQCIIITLRRIFKSMQKN